MASDEQADELGLRDYLTVLRRRKSVIALSVMAVVAAALILSLLQTPVYAAKAEVLLEPRPTETLFDTNNNTQVVDPQRQVQTQIRIFKSRPVRDAVRQKLGAAPSVSVSPVGQTDVVQVEATNTVPKAAQEIANAYANAYIDIRRTQAVNDILAASQQIQTKIDDFQKQIDAPGTQAAQRDSLIGQQALFKQKLDQLQVDSALKTGGAQLVTPAILPSSPASPRPVRNAILALFGGLVLGVGLAFLVDYLDDSVKSKEDLERVAPIPVVGLIPAVTGWKSEEEPLVISLADSKSPAAEAYRTLRTSIQFVALEQPIRTLQVTSPSAQEGKTTTLANLGVALARAGQRVILVCCDLRRPRLHEFFGLDNDVGFTSVLLGKVPLTAALQPVREQTRLSLLASGPMPPNPSELLSSRRTVEVLTSLQGEADVVLIDSPPILPVTDALVLSGRVDATLLVCVAGLTAKRDAARALELLGQVNAPLVGTVLNGVTDEGAYGYNYQYYRYDEHATAGTSARRPQSTRSA